MDAPPFAMTVDVEEWFTGVADTPDRMRKFGSRLEIGLARLLDLFERTKTRATFFFLGYIAEQRPEWVAEVVRRGHEIGCHGFYHRPLWDMTPAEFRVDIARARIALLAAGAREVQGFRAPLFSIRRDTLWAVNHLEDLGFRYSSSVFPIHNPRYGFPEAPHVPYLATMSGRFSEFPMSTLGLGPVRLPFSGGFYARVLPRRMVELAFARLRALGHPGVCYVHPWELDPDQPLLPTGLAAHLRHRVGLTRTELKLELLLRRFCFIPMGEALDALAPGLKHWPTGSTSSVR